MRHPALPDVIAYKGPTAWSKASTTNLSEALMVLRTSLGSDKKSLLFTLEFTNRPDNRLLPEFLQTLLVVLDDVDRAWRADRGGYLERGPGTGAAALITCGPLDAHRFYSNGLNLDNGPRTMPGFFENLFHKVLWRLLTYPIPTIAAINGHAFAGGFTLALSHDYRILKNATGKGGQAMLCMNEVHFGAVIPDGMTAVVRAKAASAQTLTRIVVEGHRFKGEEALRTGLVDALASTGDETIAKARAWGEQLALLASKGAVGPNKVVMYKSLLPDLQLPVAFGRDAVVDYDEEQTRKLGISRSKL